MQKRILTLLLCALMASSVLTACGDSTTAEDETTETVSDNETEAAETEITRENTPDTLPDNLDFAGTTSPVNSAGPSYCAETS